MELKKISKNIYEIPKQGNMNVPARIFASEKLIESIKQDKTLQQAINVAQLPGVLNASFALSDAHQGYGFPIGGVAAFDMEKGIISPGGVGYDINCGVRLLKTNLTKKDILENQDKIADAMFRKIPSGIGRGSKFQLTKDELKKILEGGSKYMVKKGYGIESDYLHTEEEGCMKNANSSNVSERAMKRGIGQLGTLGSGNHFLEVQYVDEIFDEEKAKRFGLKKNHQVASDYIKKMEEKYGIKNLPDRELVNAPIKSQLGKDYISAMSAAMNFAFANRQLITHWVREELKYFFPKSKIEVVYDVCHNIAKFEEYIIDGKKKIVCVHRKGATRSFGKGRKEIPLAYREIGQPVIIPGSMGTSSYVLIGTKKAEEISFGSTVHGAGRIKSRASALKILNSEEIGKKLESRGIKIRTGSMKSLSEEAPEVYKDVDEVVKVVDELGISKKVAKLKPLIVVKG